MSYLIKHFVKNAKDFNSPRVKQAYATVCACVGIVLNLLLFGIKFFAGTISHSMTILADGYNNLTDAITTAGSLAGIWAAGHGATRKHPFGSGRAEWITGLFGATTVVVVGVELVRSSYEAIIHPTPILFNTTVLIILIVSIALKFYMYSYNHHFGKLIGSETLKATASDCVSDTWSTVAVLIASLISAKTGWNIDGWCSMAVSIIIIKSGLDSMIEIINRIIGTKPDDELQKTVDTAVAAHPCIESCNELRVNDYGFGRYLICMRILGKQSDAQALYEASNDIICTLYEHCGAECYVQVELRDENAPRAAAIKTALTSALSTASPGASIEDLRINIDAPAPILIADIEIPSGDWKRQEDIEAALKAALETVSPGSHCVIRTLSVPQKK